MGTNLEQVREKLFSAKSSSELMNDEIKTSFNRIKEKQLRRLKQDLFNEEAISDEDYQKISELADFISQYVRDVGKEQAVLDVQVGLNLLNSYKKESIVESKIQLKEDSDFGEKTFNALFDVMKNYNMDVIKRYVKLDALNNQIWKTKNLSEVNTDLKVEQVGNQIVEKRF